MIYGHHPASAVREDDRESGRGKFLANVDILNFRFSDEVHVFGATFVLVKTLV